jgi:exosortase A
MSSMPAPMVAARLDRNWLTAGAVVLLLTVVFFAHWVTAGSLFALWSDTDKTTYTHGYITAGIVAWLVFRRRDELAALPWRPNYLAAGLLLAVGFAWLVSVRAGIEIFHQLLMLAAMWLSVWAVFGPRIAWTLCIPVGFLVFAIPVWDFINPLLQEGTVIAVALLLKLVSIPAYVEGNFVHLAAGVFEIAGGCSGIHFMIVGLALGVLYGELGRDPPGMRLKLVLLAVAMALLTNWLRVFIIVVAGYLTDMRHYLIVEEHYSFGWVVFSVMMFVFFLLARRLAPLQAWPVPAPPQSPPVTTRALRSLPGMLGVACVLAAPAFAWLDAPAPARAAIPSSLPSVPGGWSQAPAGLDPHWNPVFQGADLIERAEYVNAAGQRVQLFSATYASQDQDKELISYGNSLIGPEGGREVAASSAGVARELTLQQRERVSLVRYHYVIGGHRTARGLEAQLRQGLLSLGRDPLASVVALRTDCEPDCAAARRLLDEWNQGEGP